MGVIQYAPPTTFIDENGRSVSVSAENPLPVTFTIDPSTIEHGELAGLGDDDHLQYHNDARALTWLGTRSTADLPEGANLYFTDERAQDAIGGILTNTSSINFTYNDGGNTISAAINPAYVGQTSITTLGTITTGTWNATTIAANKLTVMIGDSGSGGVQGAVPAPAAGDAAAGYFLKADGTWDDPAFVATPPGGSDTQVQFNDGGSFGGDAGFVYDKTSTTATIDTLELTNPLDIAFGGTGSTTDSDARVALGVEIGVDVQAYDATLDSFAAYNTNGLLTQTAANTFTGRTLTGTASRISVSNGNGVSGNPTVDIDAAYVGQASITTLGTITTGTWTGTAIAVANGGTGATDASGARTNLGLAIGSNVQAYDATLAAWAAYNTNGILTQTAADTFTGRTLTGTSNRLSITNGDGVSGNPTFDISSSYVGQATITTLGTITTGTWTGTDIAVADGGTGASDASTARTNLGLAIGSQVQAYDATLAALAAYNTNGLLVQTAADTFVGRSFADSSSVSWTNPAGAAGNPTAAVIPGGVSHNSLADLTTGDVHTQYALLAGRSGGQTLIGGTASGNSLTLQSTSHGTKGKLLFGTSAYDEVNNRLGVGTASPAAFVDIQGTWTDATGAPNFYYRPTANLSSVTNHMFTLAPTVNTSVTTNVLRIEGLIQPTADGTTTRGINVVHNVDTSSNTVTGLQAISAACNTNAGFTGASLTTGIGFNAPAPAVLGTRFSAYYSFRAQPMTSNANNNNGNTSGTIEHASYYGMQITAGAGGGGTMNNHSALLNVPNGSGGTTNNYGLRITGNSTSGTTNYSLYNDSTAPSYFAGNVGLGTSTFGASMTNGYAQMIGTAPTGNVTDCFQHYAADTNGAGTAGPFWRIENGDIVRLCKIATYSTTSPSVDRTWNASSAAIGEVRNVLSTVIADLQALGIFG